jgi:hypothetical protein
MGTHEEYLALLGEQGLKESDIEPMMRRQYWSPDALAKLNKYRRSLENPFRAYDTLRSSLGAPFGLLGAMMEILGDHDRANQLEKMESGNANMLLEGLASDLRRRCSGNRMPHVETPVFHGVYPTKLFNAVTVPRSSGHLVLMESATLEIIEVVTSLIMAQSEVSDDHLRNIEMICQGYWDNISARLRDRYLPPHVEIYDLELNISADEHADSVELTTTTEEFVIAHEWGHISLGHAVAEGPCALGVAQTDAISNSESTWEDEFSADLWAARALLGPARNLWYGENADADLSLAGIHLFLGLARIIESFASHDGHEATTHPPTSERIWMINQLDMRVRGTGSRDSRCKMVDDALDGAHLRAFGPIPNISEERRGQLTRLYNGIVRNVFAYEKELLIR